MIFTDITINKVMSDNKNMRDGRDRSKVDANDSSEVEYIHKQFPQFSHQEILQAVKAHGPSRASIMDFLNKRR
jgi:hypothetical protein